jgi:hypothetical protein
VELGPAAPDGTRPRVTVINDPLAGFKYTFDTSKTTVSRTPLPPSFAAVLRRTTRPEPSFGVLMPTSAAHRRMAGGDPATPMPEPKREKLEAQVFEGLMAAGTRITVTIPAGEFDNEQPLEVTYEQWYSPELKMVVMMRHNDPRFGETIFRLTNITRAEPAPELFAPPAGLRVVEGREPPTPGPLLPGRP